jgi:hypothetical protein
MSYLTKRERKGSDPAPKSNFTGIKFGYLMSGDAIEKGRSRRSGWEPKRAIAPAGPWRKFS